VSLKTRLEQVQIGILPEGWMVEDLERDERIVLRVDYQRRHADVMQEAIRELTDGRATGDSR